MIRVIYLFATGGAVINPIECYEYNVTNQGLGYRMNRAYPKFPNAHIIFNLAIQDDAEGNGPDASNDLSGQYEIEYIRFYKQVGCVDDVTILNNTELNLDPYNYNFLTGNTVTLGDNVSVDEEWIYGVLYEGQLNVSAKTQVVLSNGFTVSPGSSFSASIDNNLYCCPKSLDNNGLVSELEPDESVRFSSEWIAYPNPTSNILNVDIIKKSTYAYDYSLSIADLLGRKRKQLMISKSENRIDIAELESGSCIVTIINLNENTQESKIIVVN